MPVVNFEFPSEVKKVIEMYPNVKWGDIVQTAIWDVAKKIELSDLLTKSSRFKHKDVREIDDLIKEGLLERYISNE